MYLDPGFGGMLVQVLIAIVAVGGALIFSLRRKIRVLFSKNNESNVREASIDADASDASKNKAANSDDAIDMLTEDETVDE